MINDTDEKGNTALWYTIKYRNSRAAIKLVEHRADYWSRRDKQVQNNHYIYHTELAYRFECANNRFVN